MAVKMFRGKWTVDVWIQLPGRSAKRIRRQAPVQTKAAAALYERQLLEAEYRLGGRSEKTFGEFVRVELKAYAKANNSPAEIDRKRKALEMHLLPFFGSMYLRDISAKSIEQYKTVKLAQRSGRSEKSPTLLTPKTVANHLSILRKALNLAKEYGEIEVVPVVKAPTVPPSKFDFLSHEESAAFIAAALPRWRGMVTVAIHTGLRIGELRALRWEDVDFERSRLSVRQAATLRNAIKAPKNNRFRYVQLNEVALASLKAHRHLRSKLVFCNEDGSMMHEYECKPGVKTTSKRAKLGRIIGWHVLRHTYASHRAMRGDKLMEIQEALGHSSLAMTLRYAHLQPDVRKEAPALPLKTESK